MEEKYEKRRERNRIQRQIRKKKKIDENKRKTMKYVKK